MKEPFKIGDVVKCINAHGSVTLHKTYEVVDVDSDGDVFIINDRGIRDMYFKTRFELFMPLLTFEEQIALAKSYVGKLVKDKDGRKYESIGWGITSDIRSEKASSQVQDEIKTTGYCVYVFNIRYSIPVMNITDAVTNSVPLNDTYTAIIDGDTVKVGCQTFPISKIEEILKLHKELKS